MKFGINQKIENEEIMKSLIRISIALAVAFMIVWPVANYSTAQDKTPQSDESQTPGKAAKSVSVVPGCGCCKSGGAAQTSPIILALDIDKDGQISAAEIRNASQSLAALDNNGDGNLNRDEMHAPSEFPTVNASSQSKLILGVTRDYYAQKMLLRDTNENGQLEMDEMNGPTLAILEFIDTDGDLILTYEELRNINKPQPQPLVDPGDKKTRTAKPRIRSQR